MNQKKRKRIPPSAESDQEKEERDQATDHRRMAHESDSKETIESTQQQPKPTSAQETDSNQAPAHSTQPPPTHQARLEQTRKKSKNSSLPRIITATTTTTTAQHHLNINTHDHRHPRSPDIEIIRPGADTDPLPHSDPIHRPNSNPTQPRTSNRSTTPSPSRVSSSSSLPPPSPSSSSPSTPSTQALEPIPIQPDSLNRSLFDALKFIILEGHGLSSTHQAYLTMTGSARALLEEDPEEAIYQTELDEKNALLNEFQADLDHKLDRVVIPIVDRFTQFIQAHVQRDLTIKFNQSTRFQKKLDKKLERFQKSQSSSKTSPRPSSVLAKLASIESNLESLRNDLSQTKLDLDQKLEGVLERVTSQLDQPQRISTIQSILDSHSNQIQAIQLKLNQPDLHPHHPSDPPPPLPPYPLSSSSPVESNPTRSVLDQLRSKLSVIETNLDHQLKSRIDRLEDRLTELENNRSNPNWDPKKSTTAHSHSLSSSSLIMATPTQPPTESHKTPGAGNELRLALSPQTSTAQISNPSRSVAQQKKPNHLFPSQPLNPKPTPQTQHAVHPLPTVAESNSSPINPTRNPPGSNATSNNHRTKRSSIDTGSSPGRPSTMTVVDNPSGSPVQATSSLHPPSTHPSFSQSQLDEIYNYTSQRLMKSGWFGNYTKSKLTEIYQQSFHQGLEAYFHQFGFNLAKFTELSTFMNTLPDLDLAFLRKETTIAPVPINHNLPITHLHPQPNPQNGGFTNNLSIGPTTWSPFNPNLNENLSLSALKEMLAMLRLGGHDLTKRFERLEIRFANIEKMGCDNCLTVLSLVKRMEFSETKISHIVSSTASTDDLYLLRSDLDSLTDKCEVFQTEQLERLKSIQTEPSPIHNSHSRPAPLSLSIPPRIPSPVCSDHQHQTGSTLDQVEGHILKQLLIHGVRSFPRLKVIQQENGKQNSTGAPEAKDPLSDPEEGEESEEGEAEEETDVIWTDEDLQNERRRIKKQIQGWDAHKSIKSSWKVFFEILSFNSKWLIRRSAQQLPRSATVLSPQPHDHHHHHHHHHHHRIKMVLGIDEQEPSSSTIECLKMQQRIERGDSIDRQRTNESRREELAAERSIILKSSSSNDVPSQPSVQPS